MFKSLLIFSTISLYSFSTFSQNNLEDYKKRDSIFFAKPYPYILPILGDRAHKKGFKMPLPFGVMFNTLVVKQSLSIDRLNVGFGNHNSENPPKMYDLSNIVAFNDIVAQTSTYNVRLDAWPLPFLNVYGIFGKTRKSDVQIPMTQPFSFTFNTDVAGWYAGYGGMINGKIGPIFLSLDGNQSFNHNPRLNKPTVFTILSGRIGPIINFKRNPDMKFIFWLGAMHSKFNGQTIGSIDTKDLAPNAELRVEQMQNSLDSWYYGLGPIQQKLYKDIYTKLYDGLGNLKGNIGSSYISYDMNKTSPRPWNLLTGIQYQYNDHWQARIEAQFFGARIAGLFSVNYRFGIRGRNWFSK